MLRGNGWLTRALKNLNAKKVVGTDLSMEMIKMAREYNTDGIEYFVENARTALPGNFDLVTSNWLLVNARTRKELAEMCEGSARKLKSGGRLVTVVTNPDIYSYGGDLSEYRKYGLAFVLPKIATEGSAITISCLDENTGETMLEVDKYYFSRETYISQLEAAGFENVRVHNTELAPRSDGVDDSDYLKAFFRSPLKIAITAIKT